jgi:hypothetical protein
MFEDHTVRIDDDVLHAGDLRAGDPCDELRVGGRRHRLLQG